MILFGEISHLADIGHGLVLLDWCLISTDSFHLKDWFEEHTIEGPVQ